MEENKDILNEFGKRKKPEVPEGFFENFADELMAKIADQESGLDQLHKTTKPDVPAEFFENFAANVATNLPQGEQQTEAKQPTEQDKPVQIISLKIMGFVSAVAACLLVMFAINNNEPDSSPTAENDPVIQPIEDEITDEDLLAYLDEDDLVDYILEEEIAFDEVSETSENESSDTPSESSTNLDDLEEEDILYYLEDDLDDIYLDDFEL